MHSKEQKNFLPSSIIRTLVLAHRVEAFLFLLIFAAKWSADSIPNPIPAKEWIVTPPILHAAIPIIQEKNIDQQMIKKTQKTTSPVDAVIATAS